MKSFMVAIHASREYVMTLKQSHPIEKQRNKILFVATSPPFS